MAPGGVRSFLAQAVADGGGLVVEPAEAEALVWSAHEDPDGLAQLLAGAPGIAWVQLPWAGVEPYVEVIRAHAGRRWTCGKGVYAEHVAEHALALGLAGLRALPDRVRARTWGDPAGVSLVDGRATILGGGGIAQALLALLAPMRTEVTVVRRRPEPLPGAARVVGPGDLHAALAGADLVVLALALTPETAGIIDAAALRRMERHAWLVNVARGGHVVTDDLVRALREGWIGGAALDVTDPEPLPDGHPLWDLPNVIITPHCANTPEMAVAPLSARVRENVRRYAAGEPLLGPVDPDAGY